MKNDGHFFLKGCPKKFYWIHTLKKEYILIAHDMIYEANRKKLIE